jgi:hypothetical protein
VTPKVDVLVDIPESIVRTSLWPKAMGEIREACLEYRFDYDFDSRLNNAVCHRGNPQWPLPAVGFRYVYAAHRHWPIALLTKLFCQFPE